MGVSVPLAKSYASNIEPGPTTTAFELSGEKSPPPMSKDVFNDWTGAAPWVDTSSVQVLRVPPNVPALKKSRFSPGFDQYGLSTNQKRSVARLVASPERSMTAIHIRPRVEVLSVGSRSVVANRDPSGP
jgi:hypothetical protein